MYLAEVYFWFLPEYQSYYAVIVMFDSRFMLLWTFVGSSRKAQNMD
jgi:hypothetical protein